MVETSIGMKVVHHTIAREITPLSRQLTKRRKISIFINGLFVRVFLSRTLNILKQIGLRNSYLAEITSERSGSFH
jgi:hypothetical protein